LISGFRLVSLIGRGGMGQVWEARQLSLDRAVAMKFVRHDRVTDRNLRYFEREARAGGRLAHPGLVTVYESGVSDGLAWIAMELVSGCWSLRDVLEEQVRRKEFPEGYDREVARLVAEIAQAMEAAHANGVVHRDLKPQNILLTPEGRPKVGDFGLARILGESGLSRSDERPGTDHYMSPEQVGAKKAELDHRTDVFSLGVVLYELLTLQRPFQGDTTHQVHAQILSKDPPDPRTIRSRIPRDLAVICLKALEKERRKRYATMADLAEDLKRFLADEPIAARSPSRVERLARWTRRNPGRSAAGLLALALPLAGGFEWKRVAMAAERKAALAARCESPI
jgi:serine/threonine-protein kinase